LNASVHLLRKAVKSTVHLRSEVRPGHASAPILGTERIGAGTVIEPTGLVITAHYLVIGARSVEVTPFEGEALPGRVVGIDHSTGIAAVHVGAPKLPGLRIRETKPDIVGEEAFLVAVHEDGRRVSSGVVTSYAAFEAFWEYMVDHALTCSAASPGLGGGPLVDAKGEMLGVVSLSLAEVGKFTLAIPSCSAADMLRAIEKDGGYTGANPRAWIGITCYPIGSNVIVAAVLPDSPAEAAGLSSGDIVVAVDGTETTDRRMIYEAIWRKSPGDTIRLSVRRGDDLLQIDVESISIETFFG